MKRRGIGAAIVIAFGLSAVFHLQAGAGLLFEGKVSGPDGRPVAGAEVALVDTSGQRRYHTYSDLEGQYRFPILPAGGAAASSYRIEITHLRYQAVRLEDALRGARVMAPKPEDLAPGMTAALLASTDIVRRDFLLTPSKGTPQHPVLGPIDPNFAEYCYQQALLLLSRDKKHAVELLKVYAQTGRNLKQVGRALQLIALHDK